MRLSDLKVTQALRDFLLAKGWLEKDDKDEEVRKVVETRLATRELTREQLAELTDPRAGVKQLVKDVVAEVIGNQGGGTATMVKTASRMTPSKAFSGSNGTVKKASEHYSSKRTEARHAKTMAPVYLDKEPVELPSEQERALIGVYFKRCLRKAGLPSDWTEHDEGLWQELLNEHPWTDARGDEPVLIRGDAVKGVMDDAVTGGSWLNPTVLDDAILVNLLLHSELAPYVEVRDISKGRIVRASLMGRVTSVWGIPPGTATPLFDATGLIGSVDTTVFDLAGCIEFSNELAQDSPLNVGDLLLESVTQDMLYQLDRAIAVGDGVVMPLGLANTSGLAAVTAANGTTGPPTLGDLENLIFAVGKAYRAANLAPAFVGNEVTFRRLRTIPTATTFNTRLFGEDYSSTQYTLAGFPYRVSNDITNGKLLFVGLKKYRLYRRQGIQSRVESGGKELALKNSSLLIARARFGGRLLDSKAGAVISDLQT